MADTQTGKLPQLGDRLTRATQARESATTATLTCQWCSVTLSPGVTTCPTCGSTGVPDNSMIIPDIPELHVDSQQDPLTVAQKGEGELTEWWNDETPAYRNSAEEEGSSMPVIVGLLGTGVVCVLLGLFVAPTLLASAFESSLGVTVDSTSDLRPLGGVLGLLTGAFIGAIGLWIAAPRR